MATNKFLKRLRKEMPVWVEQGWVNKGGDKAILEYVDQQQSSHILTFSLGILGVLLLGSGVISFFAANWDEMSKLSKLGVLLGSMWLSYAIASYLIVQSNMPRIGQAVLLLGVILFGANVMLIAQIYHIESHYPNGVLMWALGGVITAYLLQSQSAMVAALALASLWTGMESLEFGYNIHWWYLLFLGACLPLIYLQRWLFAAHIGMAGLLLWTLFSYGPAEVLWPSMHVLYLTQFYFICYLALFLLGMLMATSGHFTAFAPIVQRYAAFAALCSFYVLTYPRVQSGLRWIGGELTRKSADSGWLMATLLALVVVAALALWHRQRSLLAERPAYLLWGQGLVVAVIALIVANLFLRGTTGSMIAVVFNFLFFGGIVWLIYAGLHNHDRFLVNMAFVFFAVTLLTRYFDTFWTLLNRSFFFMAGGLLLIGGGYWLEKKRRSLTTQIKQQRLGEEAQL